MTLRLSEISGISRFNARKDVPNRQEIEEMAASILARGVTTPLTVRMEEGAWRALDGGRRLAALSFLAAENRLPDGDHYPVPVTFFEGDDEAAAEVSLISFVHRRDLHPVEEFERFVELSERFGLDAQAIAARTGKTVAFVKGRLRLARLSPKVRGAWRKGELTADQARAFSATDSQEAQDALLTGNQFYNTIGPRQIARTLSGNDVSTRDRRVIFAGLEAYVAAAGRLDEQLFEEESLILDVPILDAVARDALVARAEALCAAEGWGWFETAYGEAKFSDFDHVERFDLTDEEQARLNEIESLCAEAEEADDEATIASLDLEVREIQDRARLRAMPAEERATLGVFVEIGPEGEFEVSRALQQRTAQTQKEDDDHSSDARTATRGDRPREGRTPPPIEPSEPIGRTTRAILDEAATAALSDAFARNPRLAMLFMVAALGCSYGASPLHASGTARSGFEPDNALLANILHERFERALAICTRYEINDPATLPVAFAKLVGGLVDTQRLPDLVTIMICLHMASHFCDIAGDLRGHMDFEAYFKAEPRHESIDAIRAMDGQGAASDAGKLKKPELAKRAAILARDRKWLPGVFVAALSGQAGEQTTPDPDTRSTAEAMCDAIEADQAARAPGTTEAFEEKLSAAASAYSGLAEFLRVDVHFGNEALDAGRVKASELYDAYLAFCERADRKAASLREFGDVISKIGVEKKRLKTGVHYLNIALRGVAASLTAA
jgi:ParB family chromosome partitioning protein